MNHQKIGRHFGRETSHRQALFRNLTISLIHHGRIKTTLAKAKELRRVVEKLITRAKKDSLANRRLVYARIRNEKTVAKLFKELGPQYQTRPGGYLRVLKCGFRAGDNAPLALIELVQ